MKLLNPEGVSFRPEEGMAKSEIIDYDSRRTWDSGLDAGSTPARSTFKRKSEHRISVFGFSSFCPVRRQRAGCLRKNFTKRQKSAIIALCMYIDKEGKTWDIKRLV